MNENSPKNKIRNGKIDKRLTLKILYKGWKKTLLKIRTENIGSRNKNLQSGLLI